MNGLIYELSDCSELRQTLQTRPPAVVHGTAVLLVTLLAAACAWSGWVQADIVIKASGRVRPTEQAVRVFTPTLPQLHGRVTEVHFAEGQRVRKGQVLLVFDTEQLDSDIAKVTEQVETVEKEITELKRLDGLLANQSVSSQAKAKAELERVEATVARARSERASKIREARAVLAAATDQWQRFASLRNGNFVSEQELVEAASKVQQSQEHLEQVELPVGGGEVEVLRRNLTMLEDDSALRRAEIEAQLVSKLGEIQAGRNELEKMLNARKHSVLSAPIDGVVVIGDVHVGDVLEPGRPALEIASQNGFRFEATLPSGDIGELKVGMPVKVKFDAYDYQKYGSADGTVCFVSPDSKRSDAAGPNGPQVSTDPHGYVVRVELPREFIGMGAHRGQLKLGLGGVAEIVTGRESLLTILLKRIRHTISLG